MIYIAGKITGLCSEEVSAKFQKVENELHYLGLKVINPDKLGISPRLSHDEQMAICFKVIDEKATAIYLLNDWKHSKGARLEFQRVAELNRTKNRRILIYFEEMGGLSDVKRDIRDGALTCLIPEQA